MFILGVHVGLGKEFGCERRRWGSFVVVVVVVVGWKRCGCKRRQPKKNKLEGGWGGGRSASPPDALDVLASLQPNSFQDQHEHQE